MKIGIYCVSSQSGRAFLVDMIKKGCQVYGYARESEHGTEFVNTVTQQKGIFLERPKNRNREESGFIHLGSSAVGHDIQRLVDESEIIIIAHPAHYLKETIKQLRETGIAKKRTSIVLSPPRTFAVPYLWEILGDGYPFVCFSTCPYSCKAPDSGSVYIKRRKRSWLVSLEGVFTSRDIKLIESLFPQALYNHIPATTSIGNIGAVFHAGTYLLNYQDIKAAEKEGREYSFYLEGIASNERVAKHLEAIDQIRLKIAAYLGLQAFGLEGNSNEERWLNIMNVLREKEKEVGNDIEQLRRLRHNYLKEINEAIMSAQHWLDYTYGVKRIPQESLQAAIARTPTYQKMSIPQKRYVEEDVPTGLVPLQAIADRFDIDSSPINTVIQLYYKYYTRPLNADWRDLKEFSTEYIYRYLKGDFFKLID